MSISNQKQTILIKILLLGQTCVGKTSILLRYMNQIYTNNSISTIGVDFKIKLIQLDGNYYKLQIWDTAGQERHRAVAPSYYKNVEGVIFVYDITDSQSLKKVDLWTRLLDQNKDIRQIHKILVGNKKDLQQLRQIKTSQGSDYAKDHNMKFFETSAMNNENVKELFIEMIGMINKQNKRISNQKLKKSNRSQKKSQCCLE